jgi:endonuclease-3 related protein
LKDYDGKLGLLFKNDVNELRKQLLSINGIGPETADSIILYAAKKPIFVVDAYTKRIMSRIGYKEKTYDELQRLFMQNLPNSEKLFNEYHALLVELGKNICKKLPLCEKCPISKHCDYVKNHQSETGGMWH